MNTWIVIVCKGLRWAVSWSLYCLGHLVSLPMRRWGHLYPIYNKLMLWSDSVQSDMEQGPWRDAQGSSLD